MVDFKIIDVFRHNNGMVVRVEHNNPDGSFRYLENYRFQGREGLKKKRATNSNGKILMDNGRIAPMKNTPGGQKEHFLPPGRKWRLRPGLHMIDDSILDVIKDIHSQRLRDGWPQGKIDILTNFTPSSEKDQVGADPLVATFIHLIGKEE